MKQWSAFALALMGLVAALAASQRQRLDTPVSPDAALSLVADSEQELTRLPVSFTRISDQDEIDIGNRLARDYEADSILTIQSPTTPVVQAYVTRVGARVARNAHRKLPYRFHYVSNPGFVNAFALPGGHVFIGAGLMSLMTSEDELANVLGHEVEHIDHYHCAERVQTQAALQKVPLGELAAIPVEVFEAGFGKNQELEADREGTRLAVEARYSPLGAVDMLQTFDRLFQKQHQRAQSPGEELSTLAWETLEGYLRSHPAPSERLAQIKLLIFDEHWESLTEEQPLAVEYVYLTQRADRDLRAKNFAAAEAAATRSLGLHPGQIDALTTLAQAQFALMEFPAAVESYHQLLKDSPAPAATVGEFANTMATSALDARHFDQAAKYASASLDLQADNAPALTVLAEAQLATGDYTASGATYQRLARLYPADAGTVIDYAASTARLAQGQHHYQQALDVSAFWLTLHPRDKEALRINAGADLALGNFAAAAHAYRTLLDLTEPDASVDIELVWSYADALSAARQGAAAASEFKSFTEKNRTTSNPEIENQIRVEYAGLALIGGDAQPAGDLTQSARGVGGSQISPELMARLGWWYYRAGKYPEAEDLLRHLGMKRPGDDALQNDLAWVELERTALDPAMRQFHRNIGQRGFDFAQWNTPQMGMAIGLWKLHKTDEAVKDYEAASEFEPRWTDARQVQAFYSPQVAEAVSEMQAELARRVEARKHMAMTRP